MIDQAKLDRLKAFSVSATPGPWVFQPQAGKPGHGFLAQVFKGYGDEGSIVSVEATEDEGEATANAAFICAAREAIPALIAYAEDAMAVKAAFMSEIERLTRERDLARAQNNVLFAANAELGGVKWERVSPGIKEAEDERDAAIAERDRLREALTNMLALFGSPHPEEYCDGGASYRLAVKPVEEARAALTATAEAAPTEQASEQE